MVKVENWLHPFQGYDGDSKILKRGGKLVIQDIV